MRDRLFRLRPIRAALMALALMATGLTMTYMQQDRPNVPCLHHVPNSCFRMDISPLVYGVPIALVVLAVALVGKGVVHAVLGAFVCLVAGLWLGTAELSTLLPEGSSDFAHVWPSAVAVALCTWLWAAYFPDTRLRPPRPQRTFREP